MRGSNALLWIAAGLAAAIWVAIYAVTLSHSLPSPWAPAGAPLADFGAFWAAGETATRGTPEAAWDWPAMRALLTEEIGAEFSTHMLWHYSPLTQAAAQPLAWLPPEVSRIVWPLAQLALFGWVAWRILPHPVAPALAMASPPALISTYAGQIGCLMAALAGLALLWTGAAPRRGGAALALMALKPHLGVCVSLYQLRHGGWRAVFWACAALAGLIAATLALNGIAPWRAFAASIGATGGQLTAADTTARFDAFVTPFGQVRDLGFGVGAAWAAQATITLAALAFFARAMMRDTLSFERQAAIAACAIAAIAPRLFAYDMTLLVIGGLFLARDHMREAPDDRLIYALAGLYAASYLLLAHGTAVFTAAALAFVFFLLTAPPREGEKT